ncbi:hypothetical protein, partial [Pseudomonas alabamensis]|uniref:hypothetical protein n=1 Tax=Pseudomonas alabamensis TaxID=3064349 RepID=UPI0021D7DE53
FQLFLDSRNLLINKAFIVPTALEVVRIIRGSETPSTLYFKKHLLASYPPTVCLPTPADTILPALS